MNRKKTVTFKGRGSSSQPKQDGWAIGPRYQKFKDLNLLGKGSYGIVCKATDLGTKEVVAIKKIQKILDHPIRARRCYREMRILRHLQHPNIVALLDVLGANFDEGLAGRQSASPSESDLYLVFEYIDTDLQRIIKSDQTLGEEQISYMLYQLLDGLAYVHRANVIHRDIKPENVLVSCRDSTIKIADFGLARVVGEHMLTQSAPLDTAKKGTLSRDDNEETEKDEGSPSMPLEDEGSLPAGPTRLRGHLTKHVVTRPYRAPEVILSQPYSTAVDIWSAGCIFAELLELMISEKGRKGRLFPGESCGELSGEDLIRADEGYTQQQLQESYLKNRGQLNVIFDVIGTPTEEDLSYLDPCTAEMLRGVEKREGTGLSDRFAFVETTEAIDLLCAMLHFDPRRRISAVQALDHPFFDKLKQSDYFSTYHDLHADPLNVDEEESTGNLESMIKKELMIYRQRDRRPGKS